MNCVKALGVLMLAAGSSANATSAGGQAGESTVSYGQKGMQYLSTDGNNFLWFGVRLQTRYRYTSIRRDDLPGQSSITDSKLELRRGRLKLGGHLATPKFTVYSEYDFSSLRCAMAMLTRIGVLPTVVCMSIRSRPTGFF
jgi:hypothetical protein